MSASRLRGLRGLFWRAVHWVGRKFTYLRSFLRRRRQIVRMWPEGRIQLGENVALFIHFDPHARLADHVVGYVRALRDSGFSVVFVTNSGRQNADSLAVLKPLCHAVAVRRNVGYDFGAVRELLDVLSLPRPETQRLLIANDSVYGPLAPLQDMLDRVDFDQADIWGLTESWQFRYHLQSYFLLVGRRAMTSRAWQAFWQSVRPVSSKEWVIAKYEVGLTQKLLKAGLRCRALWPYHELLQHCEDVSVAHGINSLPADPLDLVFDPPRQVRLEATLRIRRAAAHLTPLNPTAELWRQLLVNGFPFIKVELLRENPTGVPDVADWRSVLASLPDADVAMIERDLQLKMKHRAP